MTLPDLCPDCKHPKAEHFSTGCLTGLGRCPCPHDFRPADLPP